MRRYGFLTIFSVFVLFFSFSSAVGAQESPFQPTAKELAQGLALPQKYVKDNLSLAYPSNWHRDKEVMPSVDLVVLRQTEPGKFRTNMNVIKQASAGDFAGVTAGDFSKDLAKVLTAQGISNIEFVVAQKGKWQGADALYLEYKAAAEGFQLYFSQYYYDNGQEAFIITFAASQDEWPKARVEARKIIASVKFSIA